MASRGLALASAEVARRARAAKMEIRACIAGCLWCLRSSSRNEGYNVGMRFTFELQYCRGNWEMAKATEFKPEVKVLV